MSFYCFPYWIEEICDTPAELLASRDTAAARRGGLARRLGEEAWRGGLARRLGEEAWQAVGGKGADF
ncbi:hypothetical protein SOP93_13265 [Peribacillus frigoritolerans]|nr:hypothetical protein [Peribacillus frigoritolerans]